MEENTVEISQKGKWVKVPAININGRTVVATGRWIKIAEVKDEFWEEEEVEDPESYIRRLKENRSKIFKADIFTFTQKLPNTTPKHPYPMVWDNIAAIHLSSYEEWRKGLSSDTRRNVTLAAKRGVVTRVKEFDDDLIRAIMEINNEIPRRQGKPFHHYGKSFDAVKKDYSTFLDRSEYIGAYFEDEMIAFLQIIYVGRVAAIMQNMSKMSHYDKKAANALIAKAVEHCSGKNATYLTYIRYRYGNKRQSSLTEFKKRNGFKEILVPKFFVPLTLKGKVAMAAGLHRSLGEILPGSLLDVLLRLRTVWRGWRFGNTV